MKIILSKDFSEIPGGRYRRQGSHSAEEFRDEYLYPKYLACVEKNEKLIIDLDGGYGCATTFLEETFGGLIRRLKRENKDYKEAINIIEIISIESPEYVTKSYEFMKDMINDTY